MQTVERLGVSEASSGAVQGGIPLSIQFIAKGRVDVLW